jgi:sterol 3beta-glucosyltransferase
MRIAIHTYGTRGDVQPFVALSVALLAAGHEVQLAGPAPYAPLAVARSVPFHCLPPEMLNLIETREGKKAIAEGGGFLAGFKLLKHVRPLMEDLLRHEWEAARDFAPDLIVYHPKSLASLHIAERLGCSAILGSPLPISTPTSAFPSPVFPVRTLGPLNRLSHSLVVNGADLLFAGTIARWRESCLKLPGRPARRPLPSMTLYAFSRHIVPAPSDWPPDVHLTGAWFLDNPEWEMPSTLEAFIAGGEAPVYVGSAACPGWTQNNSRRWLLTDWLWPVAEDCLQPAGAPSRRLFQHRLLCIWMNFLMIGYCLSPRWRSIMAALGRPWHAHGRVSRQLFAHSWVTSPFGLCECGTWGWLRQNSQESI